MVVNSAKTELTEPGKKGIKRKKKTMYPASRLKVGGVKNEVIMEGKETCSRRTARGKTHVGQYFSL